MPINDYIIPHFYIQLFYFPKIPKRIEWLSNQSFSLSPFQTAKMLIVITTADILGMYLSQN